MDHKPGELRQMIDDMKTMIRGMGKDMAQKMGTIKEPITLDQQYQAWQEMTTGEKAQKVAEMGIEKGRQWFAAMAQMEAKRNDSRKH